MTQLNIAYVLAPEKREDKPRPRPLLVRNVSSPHDYLLNRL